jgi:hypothetical protein
MNTQQAAKQLKSSDDDHKHTNAATIYQKARSIRTTGINSDLQTATLPARSGPLGI